MILSLISCQRISTLCAALLLGGGMVLQAEDEGRVIQLKRREPDYIFRLHPEFRVEGQKPIALALRGGSAKGLAHLGVLQGFDQENIPVDALTGSSAGSLMGSLYASGFSADSIARIFKSQDFGRALDDRQREPGWSLSEDEIAHTSALGFVFRHGVLDLMPGGTRSQRVRAALMPMLGRASWLASGDFDRLRMPFRVVTSDLTTGTGKVFAQGSLVDVVMASTCLPGIFEPVEIDGHQYIDGGPFENLPIQSSRQAFPGMVQVGVAIGRAWDTAPKTNLFALLDASLDLSMMQTEIRSKAAADLVIQPEMSGAEEYDFFHQVDAIVLEGHKAFDVRREALEDLIYGPTAQGIVAAGLDLEDGGVVGAKAWLDRMHRTPRLALRDVYRLLRRAQRDLPVADCEMVLPETIEGRAVLRLRPAPIIARVILELPADWSPRNRQRLQESLQHEFGIEAGRPFHEGAWSRALEHILERAILAEIPILDFRGSGFLPDGTLRLRIQEPRISQVRSEDAAFQERLERFLEPIKKRPVRTNRLDEHLARAATRLGLTRLHPDLRDEQGELTLVLNPVKAPGIELAPQLAYESTWGGHLALDLGFPNFLGSGSRVDIHGAVNDLQSRLQAQCLGVFKSMPNFALGFAGSIQRQRFNQQSLAPVRKLVQDAYGFRANVRFGLEDRGLAQWDLGIAEGFVVSNTDVRTPQNRATYTRFGLEWDSLDAHTLPSEGLVVRAAWMRAFRAHTGSTWSKSYLRLRQMWAPPERGALPVGLDLDVEVAGQKDAPQERWFIAGGSDSFIGTSAVSFLTPNFGILRVGFPFTTTSIFGVAVQAVPRADFAWLAPHFNDLDHSQRAFGYGLVLRGILRSLYLEMAVGQARLKDLRTGEHWNDRHLGFLIGTRPFDIWKER